MPRHAFTTIACVTVLSVCSSFAPAGDTLHIRNDHPDTFEIRVKPSIGQYHPPLTLRPGQRMPIPLGADYHQMKISSLSTPGRSYQIRQARLVGRDEMDLTKILTRAGKTRSGHNIYQYMPEFPRTREYDHVERALRDSTWNVPMWCHGKLTHVRITFDDGGGSFRTHCSNGFSGEMDNVKYIPGREFIVLGDWSSNKNEGRFVFYIDSQNANSLKGDWKNGWHWLSVRGQRQCTGHGHFTCVIP